MKVSLVCIFQYVSISCNRSFLRDDNNWVTCYCRHSLSLCLCLSSPHLNLEWFILFYWVIFIMNAGFWFSLFFCVWSVSWLLWTPPQVIFSESHIQLHLFTWESFQRRTSLLSPVLHTIQTCRTQSTAFLSDLVNADCWWLLIYNENGTFGIGHPGNITHS